MDSENVGCNDVLWRELLQKNAEKQVHQDSSTSWKLADAKAAECDLCDEVGGGALILCSNSKCAKPYHIECAFQLGGLTIDRGMLSFQCEEHFESIVFCSCKQPYDEDRDMVCCDECCEWFHNTCVGPELKQLDLREEKFVCKSCSSILSSGKTVSPTLKEKNLSKEYRSYCNQTAMKTIRIMVELAGAVCPLIDAVSEPSRSKYSVKEFKEGIEEIVRYLPPPLSIESASAQPASDEKMDTRRKGKEGEGGTAGAGVGEDQQQDERQTYLKEMGMYEIFSSWRKQLVEYVENFNKWMVETHTRFLSRVLGDWTALSQRKHQHHEDHDGSTVGAQFIAMIEGYENLTTACEEALQKALTCVPAEAEGFYSVVDCLRWAGDFFKLLYQEEKNGPQWMLEAHALLRTGNFKLKNLASASTACAASSDALSSPLQLEPTSSTLSKKSKKRDPHVLAAYLFPQQFCVFFQGFLKTATQDVARLNEWYNNACTILNQDLIYSLADVITFLTVSKDFPARPALYGEMSALIASATATQTELEAALNSSNVDVNAFEALNEKVNNLFVVLPSDDQLSAVVSRVMFLKELEISLSAAGSRVPHAVALSLLHDANKKLTYGIDADKTGANTSAAATAIVAVDGNAVERLKTELSEALDARIRSQIEDLEKHVVAAQAAVVDADRSLFEEATSMDIADINDQKLRRDVLLEQLENLKVITPEEELLRFLRAADMLESEANKLLYNGLLAGLGDSSSASSSTAAANAASPIAMMDLEMLVDQADDLLNNEVIDDFSIVASRKAALRRIHSVLIDLQTSAQKRWNIVQSHIAKCSNAIAITAAASVQISSIGIEGGAAADVNTGKIDASAENIPSWEEFGEDLKLAMETNVIEATVKENAEELLRKAREASSTTLVLEMAGLLPTSGQPTSAGDGIQDFKIDEEEMNSLTSVETREKLCRALADVQNLPVAGELRERLSLRSDVVEVVRLCEQLLLSLSRHNLNVSVDDANMRSRTRIEIDFPTAANSSDEIVIGHQHHEKDLSLVSSMRELHHKVVAMTMRISHMMHDAESSSDSNAHQTSADEAMFTSHAGKWKTTLPAVDASTFCKLPQMLSAHLKSVSTRFLAYHWCEEVRFLWKWSASSADAMKIGWFYSREIFSISSISASLGSKSDNVPGIIQRNSELEPPSTAVAAAEHLLAIGKVITDQQSINSTFLTGDSIKESPEWRDLSLAVEQTAAHVTECNKLFSDFDDATAYASDASLVSAVSEDGSLDLAGTVDDEKSFARLVQQMQRWTEKSQRLCTALDKCLAVDNSLRLRSAQISARLKDIAALLELIHRAAVIINGVHAIVAQSSAEAGLAHGKGSDALAFERDTYIRMQSVEFKDLTSLANRLSVAAEKIASSRAASFSPSSAGGFALLSALSALVNSYHKKASQWIDSTISLVPQKATRHKTKTAAALWNESSAAVEVSAAVSGPRLTKKSDILQALAVPIARAIRTPMHDRIFSVLQEMEQFRSRLKGCLLIPVSVPKNAETSCKNPVISAADLQVAALEGEKINKVDDFEKKHKVEDQKSSSKKIKTESEGGTATEENDFLSALEEDIGRLLALQSEAELIPLDLSLEGGYVLAWTLGIMQWMQNIPHPGDPPKTSAISLDVAAKLLTDAIPLITKLPERLVQCLGEMGLMNLDPSKGVVGFHPFLNPRLRRSFPLYQFLASEVQRTQRFQGTVRETLLGISASAPASAALTQQLSVLNVSKETATQLLNEMDTLLVLPEQLIRKVVERSHATALPAVEIAQHTAKAAVAHQRISTGAADEFKPLNKQNVGDLEDGVSGDKTGGGKPGVSKKRQRIGSEKIASAITGHGTIKGVGLSIKPEAALVVPPTGYTPSSTVPRGAPPVLCLNTTCRNELPKNLLAPALKKGSPRAVGEVDVAAMGRMKFCSEKCALESAGPLMSAMSEYRNLIALRVCLPEKLQVSAPAPEEIFPPFASSVGNEGLVTGRAASGLLPAPLLEKAALPLMHVTADAIAFGMNSIITCSSVDGEKSATGTGAAADSKLTALQAMSTTLPPAAEHVLMGTAGIDLAAVDNEPATSKSNSSTTAVQGTGPSGAAATNAEHAQTLDLRRKARLAMEDLFVKAIGRISSPGFLGLGAILALELEEEMYIKYTTTTTQKVGGGVSKGGGEGAEGEKHKTSVGFSKKEYRKHFLTLMRNLKQAHNDPLIERLARNDLTISALLEMSAQQLADASTQMLRSQQHTEAFLDSHRATSVEETLAAARREVTSSQAEAWRDDRGAKRGSIPASQDDSLSTEQGVQVGDREDHLLRVSSQSGDEGDDHAVAMEVDGVRGAAEDDDGRKSTEREDAEVVDGYDGERKAANKKRSSSKHQDRGDDQKDNDAADSSSKGGKRTKRESEIRKTPKLLDLLKTGAGGGTSSSSSPRVPSRATSSSVAAPSALAGFKLPVQANPKLSGAYTSTSKKEDAVRLLNSCDGYGFVLHKPGGSKLRCSGIVCDRRVQGLLPKELTIIGRTRTEELERFINEVLSTKKKHLVGFRLQTDSSQADAVGYNKFCEEFTRDSRAGLINVSSSVQAYILPPAFMKLLLPLQEFFLFDDPQPQEPHPLGQAKGKSGELWLYGIAALKEGALLYDVMESAAAQIPAVYSPPSAAESSGVIFGSQKVFDINPDGGIDGMEIQSVAEPKASEDESADESMTMMEINVPPAPRPPTFGGVSQHPAAIPLAPALTCSRAAIASTISTSSTSPTLPVSTPSLEASSTAPTTEFVQYSQARPQSQMQPPPVRPSQETIVKVAKFCASKGVQTLQALKDKAESVTLMPFLFEGNVGNEEFIAALKEAVSAARLNVAAVPAVVPPPVPPSLVPSSQGSKPTQIPFAGSIASSSSSSSSLLSMSAPASAPGLASTPGLVSKNYPTIAPGLSFVPTTGPISLASHNTVGTSGREYYDDSLRATEFGSYNVSGPIGGGGRTDRDRYHDREIARDFGRDRGRDWETASGRNVYRDRHGEDRDRDRDMYGDRDRSRHAYGPSRKGTGRSPYVPPSGYSVGSERDGWGSAGIGGADGGDQQLPRDRAPQEHEAPSLPSSEGKNQRRSRFGPK